MRLPCKPPAFHEVMRTVSPERITDVLLPGMVTVGERYLHWDELRHREPPAGLTHEEWWAAIKLRRLGIMRWLPLEDPRGRPSSYSTPDIIQAALHRIDQLAGGQVVFSEAVTTPSTRDRYIISSLIEEAITSSQLEGASTSRRVAKEMIRSGRRPRDRSERMILNNYNALNLVRGWHTTDLTPQLIRELHRVVTDGTLDDRHDAGRVQGPAEERIRVLAPDGVVLHTPPPAEQLGGRLEALCVFANGQEVEGFLHPVVRAVIVHFWLAYDHPFVDGNGRTARALFYWSMLSQGYWLAEYLSISRILRKAPAEYGRSFLHTETDELDVTYFIAYQLRVVIRAIDELKRYLERKMTEVAETERRLRNAADLNGRQLALLSHALRHPSAIYTFQSHRLSHNIAYQTARADLLDLERRGLLERRTVGRAFQFCPPGTLADIIPEA